MRPAIHKKKELFLQEHVFTLLFIVIQLPEPTIIEAKKDVLFAIHVGIYVSAITEYFFSCH